MTEGEKSNAHAFSIRLASVSDIPILRGLIEASIRTLQLGDYTARQIEGAIGTVEGLDTQLIIDQTYFVVETSDARGKLMIVGCGGWSKRKTLFGADKNPDRKDEPMDPRKNPAKIRAFFVHPQWARKGIATIILNMCEKDAINAGFGSFELGSTLTGVGFYSSRGYKELDRVQVPLANGEILRVVRMTKSAIPA